ncbi:hypothetical protein SHKM778_64440 [Streptomyces sp. KM77-8]|uniref:Uncharacterized protein n=1 Tax=Streptomyces haneummycinicus TaxID=3074435 RepID=A0AAT9HRH3_9ACTN
MRCPRPRWASGSSRGDDADDAERFEEGDVHAAGDRDLPAGEAFHSAGRVVEQVADVAGLPAGVAEGVAGLADLQAGQFLEVLVDGGGEPAQQPGPVGGGEGGPGGLRVCGADDGGADVGGVVAGTVAISSSVAGLRTWSPEDWSVTEGLTCVRRSGAAPSR